MAKPTTLGHSVRQGGTSDESSGWGREAGARNSALGGP